jgi:tetratricopeptide (TPR) repeat protein
MEDFQSFKASIAEALEAGQFDEATASLEEATAHPDSSRYLDENVWLYRQLGDLHRAFDREEEAIEAYARAFEFDPRERDVLDAYAETLLSLGKTERAAAVLRSMLVHHKRGLDSAKLGWIYRQLGTHYEDSGLADKARPAFEKALQQAPDDQLALTGLLRVVGTVGEPTDVIEVRRKLIKSLQDARARSMALVAMGDDWKEKFNDPWRALDTYEEALTEDAENARALESIASVARQIGDWRRLSRAYFTLHRLAESPEEKAEWLIESSKVARQELWEPEKALTGFRRALEYDPTRLDAFKVVTSLLVDAKDWEGLEAAYLQLLSANQDREEPEVKLLTVLWQKLGDLYLNHLERTDEALTAYAQAAELMPKNVDLHERVAELAEGKAEHSDLALEHLHAIRRLDPSRVTTLARIGRVHLRKKEIDPAFIYLRTCAYLGGELGDKAHGFVQKLESPMVKVPGRGLSMDLLKRFVFSQKMQNDISRVFGTIKPALVQWVGESRRKYGLGRRDRVKFKEQLAFNNLYKQIGVSLGYDDLPELWRKPEQRGLLNGALVPEGMIVGDELLGSGREKHIAFIVGKQLFLFLSPFYLAAIRPLSDLQVFFLLAASLVNSEIEFEKDDLSVKAFKQIKKTVRGDDLKRLEHAVKKVMADGGDIDLGTWLESVEDTANRVGFVYCDDLSVAEDYLRNEPQTLGMRSVDERMQALSEYAVSDRYRTLRDELNISVG